ncbi:MAG TPA: tetratricopeptide repeat protein [Gemmatimonadales bacterium]|nr:tetratricopeptide repeat protein [Gemmatimonadales bacterium]
MRRIYGEKHEAVADAMGGMVSAALGADDFHRADSLARAAIAMLREIGSGRSLTIVPIMNDLALRRMYQGDYREATALMHQVLALDSAHFGPDQGGRRRHDDALKRGPFATGSESRLGGPSLRSG